MSRFRIIVFGFVLSFALSSTALATPGFNFNYGDWKAICGRPSQTCNAFILGFLASEEFWSEWFMKNAVKAHTDPIAIARVKGRAYDEICLPQNVLFEDIRRNINAQFKRKSGFGRPSLPDTAVIMPGASLSIYDALKNSYPCRK